MCVSPPGRPAVTGCGNYFYGMSDIKPRPNDGRYQVILRNLSPQQKVEKVFELNELTRQLAKAGIRMRNPGLSDDQIDRMAVEQALKCHNRNY